jgi:hypothetical protein
VLKSLVGDAKNVAESAKKVEDVTSFLKNVMNVVSVCHLLPIWPIF